MKSAPYFRGTNATWSKKILWSVSRLWGQDSSPYQYSNKTNWVLNWETIFDRPGYTNIFTQSSTFAPCLGWVCAWWGLRRLPRWRRCTNSDWVSCRQNRWRAHSSAVRGLSGQNIAGGKECLSTSFEPRLFRTNCTLKLLELESKIKPWAHSGVTVCISILLNRIIIFFFLHLLPNFAK